MELLEVIGFVPRWREWIWVLLPSASSSVPLKRKLGPSIAHTHGLTQRDSISWMLFILKIDPPQHLFRKATAEESD
jgi:hypothetical protein